MTRIGLLSILCAALLGVACGDDDSGSAATGGGGGTGGTAATGGSGGTGGTAGSGGSAGSGGAGGTGASTGPATPGLYGVTMGDPDGASGYEICIYVGGDGSNVVPNLACDILNSGNPVSAAARVVNTGVSGNCSFQVAIEGESAGIGGSGDFVFQNYQPPDDPISQYDFEGTFTGDTVTGVISESPLGDPDTVECELAEWVATLADN